MMLRRHVCACMSCFKVPGNACARNRHGGHPHTRQNSVQNSLPLLSGSLRHGHDGAAVQGAPLRAGRDRSKRGQEPKWWASRAAHGRIKAASDGADPSGRVVQPVSSPVAWDAREACRARSSPPNCPKTAGEQPSDQRAFKHPNTSARGAQSRYIRSHIFPRRSALPRERGSTCWLRISPGGARALSSIAAPRSPHRHTAATQVGRRAASQCSAARSLHRSWAERRSCKRRSRASLPPAPPHGPHSQGPQGNLAADQLSLSL